ncbi:CDP-glycerol glycerophosphotransferase family protein [Nocardioides aurantiacus]|uniref:CDP-glycerol glycerophosphotransferase n=1 Tax=Nocardioides aurantiacus TaxID=86796 RepID=A0A3N2CQ56_9ACTN|nr:CDP-glycerol glycerophosphotransferase family protein [Nocardioides aurantiacus]ROR89454.1 CDP-glycerol glycerophosphotransferase [Nocardioides aurantiacus]
MSRARRALVRLAQQPWAAPARRVRRRVLERRMPLLSVVVPVHDAEPFLERCVDSLVAQAARLELVIVDDGSRDASLELARSLARRHPRVVVVAQEHQGVGAARNAGVARATGDYLAFCDADDTVTPGGYDRLVAALERSGSDLAVGGALLQFRGQFSQPDFVRRSNAQRRLGVSVEEVPELLGNTVVGARVFRRSAWDRDGLRFTSDDERSDVALVVASLLGSASVDVLPAPVYRWHAREDNRSLHQRDLADPERVAERVASLRTAGLLLAERPPSMGETYFSELLHSTVPDLVRAAVCRDTDYWSALSSELARLLDSIPPSALRRVPVADRITAWLCAHDELATTEAYLEYVVDNQRGLPFSVVSGHPSIALPFLDDLADAPPGLTEVAEVDLAFRTRLVRLAWAGDGLLRVGGVAFREYLDDRFGPRTIELHLVDDAGRVVRVPTTSSEEVRANQWAARPNEDHTSAGFTADIELDRLSPGTWRVEVHLEVAGRASSKGFDSRTGIGSAGLLEPQTGPTGTSVPVWREHEGLRLRVGTVQPPPARGDRRDEGPLVESVDVHDGRLWLRGTADRSFEVRLAGPRAVTEDASAVVTDGRFEVGIDLLVDEWGVGATASLPANVYKVMVSSPGSPRPLQVARSLWRELPSPVDAEHWTVAPQVSGDGDLSVRIVPVEYLESRTAYVRRALRDELYQESRTRPLLDVVLFETFAGKGTGDNPGALCAELARRDLGLDLVFAAVDHSTVPPDGARTVIRYSAEWFELLGRARYLVVNASLPYFFRKREGQLYFQTWHGTPLKRIAHDRPHLDFFNWHHRRQLLLARDGWDFLLSQSEACGRFLSSAFRYSGPLMELGYPRNDILALPEGDAVRRRVRAHFGIPDDARVVLYAPTWRDNNRVGRVFNKVLYLDPLEVVARVPNAFVLVRGHYNSVGAAEDRSVSDRVVDVTRYPDIADLYLAADVLVTDYSSVFFDFAITDKPMVFLAPDLREYRDDNRGFYLDYHDTVPGPVCLTTAEVVEAVLAPDTYGETREAFRRRFTPHDDGGAAARVVDAILASHPLPGGRASAG